MRMYCIRLKRGLIPAGAGETAGAFDCLVSRGVDPRGCGGDRAFVLRIIPHRRLIPAGAGEALHPHTAKQA